MTKSQVTLTTAVVEAATAGNAVNQFIALDRDKILVAIEGIDLPVYKVEPA